MGADGTGLDTGADGVAEVALDLGRPAKSALRSPLSESLAAILDAVEESGAVRGVVLRLGGEPVMAEPEPGQTRARTEAQCRSEQVVVERLHASPVPFAAWLRGPVRGPVLEVALACRTRVASDGHVDLAFSDLEIGLAPRLGGLGRARALAGLEALIPLATRGRVLRARDAVALGLVDEIVPDADGKRRAAARLRDGRAPSPRRRRALWERLTDSDRAMIARTRREIAPSHDIHHPAPVRVLDILETLARSPDEAAALEAVSFAELSFSGPARHLRALREAALGLDTSDSLPLSGFPRLRERLLDQGLTYTDTAITATAAYEPFVRRTFEPLERAARALANEGVDARMIALALRDWGFLDPFTIDGPKSSPRPMARELVQMRCVLPLVAAALRALDSGEVPSAAHGDVAAVFLGGFPPFRGGPFRYVDDVGAAELVTRMDVFAREHGVAYEPPPILRDLAASGGHLYPTYTALRLR